MSIEINKPIKRGALLRMSRDGEPDCFDAQYEKLPFLYFSCGLLGHSGLKCGSRAARNAQGKLLYDRDIPLCAPDERRRKLQSFSDAATESFGKGSSSGARADRTTSGRREERGVASSKDGRRSASAADGREQAFVDEIEVTSPLKEKVPADPKEKKMGRPAMWDDSSFMGDGRSAEASKEKEIEEVGP